MKQNLPEITVPELPADPSEYYAYLTSLNLFDTATFSDNDRFSLDISIATDA